jgi:uncharacterized Rossmann fold enzyme
MNFEEWEPIYLEILEDMGYELERDLAAATLLESICPLDRICGESCLDEIIGEVVTVVGHGPNLEEELDRVEVRGNLISADGSTSALLERGMIPDIIVTDLDGEIGPEIECNGKGSIAVIHAHGDRPEVAAPIPGEDNAHGAMPALRLPVQLRWLHRWRQGRAARPAFRSQQDTPRGIRL